MVDEAESLWCKLCADMDDAERRRDAKGWSKAACNLIVRCPGMTREIEVSREFYCDLEISAQPGWPVRDKLFIRGILIVEGK